MLDLASIRVANPLPGIAARHTPLKRVGDEWVACCPFHVDRSPSFTIFAGGERFYCFGCAASGDVLDFVQRLHGVDLVEAARMLWADDIPKVAMPAAPIALRDDRSAEARTIWERTLAATGTPAESYLRFRGISLPVPLDIRFLRLPYGRLAALPCLVAAVRSVAGAVTGIQRIWLASDGNGKAELPKPKLSLGGVKGGAIRLGELDASGLLTVCEGPEDGLSLREMLGGAVWVAAGATFLPSMQFPPEIQSIVIGADNDRAGEESAQKTALVFAARGLSVRIIRPLDNFKDFNDELKAART